MLADGFAGLPCPTCLDVLSVFAVFVDVQTSILLPLFVCRCPKAISFVCSLSELCNKLVDVVLNGLLKAITGKSIDDWIAAALAELGLDEILDMIPGTEWLEAEFGRISSIGDRAMSDLTSHYTDMKNKIIMFTDMR